MQQTSEPRVSLEEAAKHLIDECEDAGKLKTKIRRLYDIANILSSLRLIEKLQLESRKPAFRWLYTELDIANAANAGYCLKWFPDNMPNGRLGPPPTADGAPGPAAAVDTSAFPVMNGMPMHWPSHPGLPDPSLAAMGMSGMPQLPSACGISPSLSQIFWQLEHCFLTNTCLVT